MKPSTPPPDAADFLAAVALLQPLDEVGRRALLDELDWLSIRGGETVFDQGDPGNAVYFVVSGRLRISVLDADHDGPRFLTDLTRGAHFGELALLTGQPRAATVRAVRDSVIAQLSDAHFERLLASHPRVALALSRALASSVRSSHLRRAAAPMSSLAIVPLSAEVPLEAFAAALERELNRCTGRRDARRITPAEVDAALGQGAWQAAEGTADDERVTSFLNSLDEAGLDLYVATPGAPGWARRCLRQADRILLIGMASATVGLGAIERELRLLAAHAAPTRCELVLLHAADTRAPTGTARWLALHPFAAHHHLRLPLEASRDMARLARCLTGRAIGLVLGGGGARAWAHAGVLKALEEHGVPIDRVGGASMGGVLAAQYALHGDAARVTENAQKFTQARIQSELTPPLISLLSTRRAEKLYEDVFGDAHLEDLWLDCFVVTANLTRCQLEVHRSGLVRHYAMAGASPPGIWPPRLNAAREFIVDGGVLDNLPAQQLADGGCGLILGSDVSSEDSLRVDDSYGEYSKPPSGWQALGRALNPFARRREFPNMVQILYTTAAMTGTHRARLGRELSALVFRPPVQEFTIGDYDHAEEMAARGYAHATVLLDALGADTLAGLKLLSGENDEPRP